jgi:predicted phosphohydrolase
MNLAWLTDVHLNFLDHGAVEAFVRTLAAMDCDGILLSGDLGEAPDVVSYLNKLNIAFPGPIYFVLGNHDFYRGSIAGVRESIADLHNRGSNLHYLPLAGVVRLTDKTCLVGADGWGDGRLGDYWSRKVSLNDWRLIEEFDWLNDQKRLDKLMELGDESAAHLRTVLPEALKRYEHVLVVTHVPPFKESCWHEGRISDDDWLPHFACKAVGDILLDTMKRWPDRQMTVYCGHTHSSGEAVILPNLQVFTGGAEYGRPAVQKLIEV